MVLAAVDDLLFGSKIRVAAGQAGVEVVFARTPEEILQRVRELRPDLVVFDLNSRQTDPLGTIAALRADPSVGTTRTIGFVSHVQGDLAEAARQAGVHQVLARSAFASRLPDLLAGGR